MSSKLRETKLRCLGHVVRRDERCIGKRVRRMKAGQTKRRRPKKRREDCINEALKATDQGYSIIMGKGPVKQIPIYAKVRINILHSNMKIKPPL